MMEPQPNQSPLFQEHVRVEYHFDAHKGENFGPTLLGLSSVRGLGRKGLRALVKNFGDALEKVWEADKDWIRELLEEAKLNSAGTITSEIWEKQNELLIEGRKKLSQLANKRVSVISPSEVPIELRTIPGAPLWLFVEGKVDVLYDRPAIAVVGTRRASDEGRSVAALISQTISAYPITLVSGLAEGIDEEAHRSSLNEGIRNVAFLGHGIDQVFPASTGRLRSKIVRSGGAVVTEYLPGERYNKSNFVERNRLQAALADIVVIVEAELKSGTAHTVRFARSFGKDVMGMSWPGANGIVSDISKHGEPVYNLFDPVHRQLFDRVVRQLAESEGHDTFAFSGLVDKFRNEAKSRRVRRSDLIRFVDELEQMYAVVDDDSNT